MGHQILQTFFVWLNTGGFPFVIDLEADKKLEVGVLARAIGIATHQLSQVRESLKGGAESCWKLLEIPIMNPGFKNLVSLAGLGYEVTIYYIEIFQTLSH